jgi:tetratricopeptide (TPR) repeat protein
MTRSAKVVLGRNDEAITVYDDMVDRFGSATELPLRKYAIEAKSAEEAALSKPKVATAASVRPLEQPLSEQLSDAQALFKEGVRLGELGCNAEAISVYDNLLARFSGATEWPLREQVAEALHNKGSALGKLGCREEAIIVYDELLNLLDGNVPLRKLRVARRLIINAKSERDRLHNS